MKTTNAKENILNKIRQALKEPVPFPFPSTEESKLQLFVKEENEAALVFAENFSKLQGKFAYCVDTTDLVTQVQFLLTQKQWTKIYCKEDSIKQLLSSISTTHESLGDCEVSITSCEALVARTGTIVLSSATGSGRTASVYAPIHICIAFTSQLNDDISGALKTLSVKYKQQLPSLISFATGPSRTADIEKTLVVGVHGPKEVYCFLVEDTNPNG